MSVCFRCFQAQERHTGDSNHSHSDGQAHPSLSIQGTEPRKIERTSSNVRPEGSVAKHTDADTLSGLSTFSDATPQAEKSDDEQVFEIYTAPNGEQHTTYVRNDGKRFYLDLDNSGVSVQKRNFMIT